MDPERPLIKVLLMAASGRELSSIDCWLVNSRPTATGHLSEESICQILTSQ